MWEPSSVEAFRAYLSPGESITWVGQPASGIRFRTADIFLIPFSLLWGGFALSWEAGVISSGAPLLFTLWGIPFVLVGIYLIVGRFFVDAYLRSRTRYALTPRRALILSRFLRPHLRSIDLKSTNEVALSMRADGTGSITFQAGGSLPWASQATFWPGFSRYTPPTFEMIADVKSVYDRIQAAKAI